MRLPQTHPRPRREQRAFSGLLDSIQSSFCQHAVRRYGGMLGTTSSIQGAVGCSRGRNVKVSTRSPIRPRSILENFSKAQQLRVNGLSRARFGNVVDVPPHLERQKKSRAAWRERKLLTPFMDGGGATERAARMWAVM